MYSLTYAKVGVVVGMDEELQSRVHLGLGVRDEVDRFVHLGVKNQVVVKNPCHHGEGGGRDWGGGSRCVDRVNIKSITT